MHISVPKFHQQADYYTILLFKKNYGFNSVISVTSNSIPSNQISMF